MTKERRLALDKYNEKRKGKRNYQHEWKLQKDRNHKKKQMEYVTSGKKIMDANLDKWKETEKGSG